MGDLTDAEREAVLLCDCGHDIGGEHNSRGCYATVDYGTRTQRACECREMDDRPSVNYAVVEAIIAARVAEAVAQARAEERERVAVLDDVLAERARQDAKWGQQNHPNGTGPTESVWNALSMPSRHSSNRMLRESAIAECDGSFRVGRGTWQHILTEEWAEALACASSTALRVELIQVAAVAVAWVEALDRAVLAQPTATDSEASR